MKLVRLLDVVATTPQERAALITFQIVNGQELTTMQVATRCGVTWGGAYRMMERISRVVPVYQEGGVWRKLD